MVNVSFEFSRESPLTVCGHHSESGTLSLSVLEFHEFQHRKKSKTSPTFTPHLEPKHHHRFFGK